MARAAHDKTGSTRAVHGGRRGPQQRRQRPHPARDAVDRSLRAAVGRRWRRGGRRRPPRRDGPAGRACRGGWVMHTGARRTARTPSREAVARSGYRAVREDDEDALVARVADLLAAGNVIGWCQGRFEFGPRALGNRSILADPRRADMKDVVNTKIKFREPYRPFAPSVPVEHAVALLRPGKGRGAAGGPVHAARLARAGRTARGDPGGHARRRLGPPADRGCRDQPALPSVADRVRAGHRHAGADEHQFQPARRADREHARRSAEHVSPVRARRRRARRTVVFKEECRS